MSVGSNLHCACQRRQSRQSGRHIHRLPPLHQARELYNREGIKTFQNTETLY